MRLPRALASIVLIVLAVTAGAATSRTTGQVKLHASPDARSATTATLPAGAIVEVSSCSASWCRVTWQGRSGWASRRYLTSPTQQKAGHGYRNSDGDWIPSPTQSPNGPPKGATAQCNDGTYSFSRHRSGTCSHHGGVRQWL